jgi:hypothetical protein
MLRNKKADFCIHPIDVNDVFKKVLSKLGTHHPRDATYWGRKVPGTQRPGDAMS